MRKIDEWVMDNLGFSGLGNLNGGDASTLRGNLPRSDEWGGMLSWVYDVLNLNSLWNIWVNVSNRWLEIGCWSSVKTPGRSLKFHDRQHTDSKWRHSVVWHEAESVSSKREQTGPPGRMEISLFANVWRCKDRSRWKSDGLFKSEIWLAGLHCLCVSGARVISGNARWEKCRREMSRKQNCQLVVFGAQEFITSPEYRAEEDFPFSPSQSSQQPWCRLRGIQRQGLSDEMER